MASRFYSFRLLGLLSWLSFAHAQIVTCPSGCLCTTVPNSATALVTNSFLKLQISCRISDPTSIIPSLAVSLTYLREFEFTGSNLQEMPTNLCTYDYIQYLDLSNNKISAIPTNVFGCLRFLVRLQMSENSVTELGSGIFDGLATLNTIDFSSNRIAYIYPTTFHSGLSQLETVDLSKNFLVNFDPWPFVLSSLVVFDVSHNQISTFTNTMNWTVEMSPSSINAYIGLQHNQFSTLSLGDFNVYNFPSIKDLWYMRPVFGYFDLRNNPFLCDCHIYEFVSYMKELSTTYPLKTSFDYQYYDVTCNAPSNLQGSVMLNLNYTEFVCTNVTLCPSGCSCTYTPSLSRTVVDCQSVGLTALPDALPTSSLILRFQDNLISNLTNRDYLARVTELYLSTNLLTLIEEDALKNLTTIEILHLDGNDLTSLPESLKAIIQPTGLDISGNNFACDCSITWLADWLRDGPHAGLGSAVCDNSSSVLQYFLDISLDNLGCIPDTTVTVKLTLYVTIAVIAVAVLILILLVIILRKWVKLFFFTYLNMHPFDKLEDDDDPETRDKEIYLSTNCQRADVRKWIQNVLIPKLENHVPSFKVFLPSRDGGKATNREVIADRLLQSKRHLFVITSEFSQSVWPLFEFRESILQEQLGNGKRMIVVIYDKDAVDQLDDGLKKSLKKHIVIHKHKRWFWPQLFYWMPFKPLELPSCNPCQRCKSACAKNPATKTVDGPAKPYKPKHSVSVVDNLSQVPPVTTTPVKSFRSDSILDEEAAWEDATEVVANRSIRLAKYPRLTPLNRVNVAGDTVVEVKPGLDGEESDNPREDSI